MPEFINLTQDIAIGPQIELQDFEALREAGFASIINARPDDETGDYLLSDAAKKYAQATGLSYVHCPTENHSIFEPENADCFEKAIATLPKRIFAHCKSGTRAAILWALAVSRHHPVEDVIATLKAASQDLEFLEQELRDSADEARKSPLRLRDDALLNLGRSNLLGRRRKEPG